MPLPIDYHNHPQGHSVRPYTQELLQPWANAARARGVQEFAFTDHDRYLEGIRFEEIEKLRHANPDLIILAGLEMDNDPVTGATGRAWVEKHWDQLDFVLGSVHYLPGDAEMFDQVTRKEEFAGRDLEKDCAHYLEQVEGMIARGGINCLAHLDLIKIHGVWHPSGGLLPRFQALLKKISQAGLALEISTAGWRKPVGEQYPHREIILAAQALDIPFTLASDAHSPAQVAEDYPRLEKLLQELKIKKVVSFLKHRAQIINLD